MLKYLRRIAIICARESRVDSTIPVSILDLDDNTIRAANSKEYRDKNQDDMKNVHDLLPPLTPDVISVIVDPKPSWQAQCKRGKSEASSKTEQVVEDRHTRSDEETGDGHSQNGSKPRRPMDQGVGLQMPRVSQDSDEDVFRADVDVESTTDAKTNQSNSEGDLLHERPCTSERG